MNNHALTKLAAADLELFERGLLPLHQLVGNLKSVQDSLTEPASSWKLDFDKCRFALEEVNALQLDDGVEKNEQYEQFVVEIVIKLKDLLRSV